MALSFNFNKRYTWLGIAAFVCVLLLSGTISIITNTQTAVPPATIKDVIYNSKFKQYCVGDLYEPSLKSGSLCPAVIVVHGGAWVTGSKNDGETKSIVEKLTAEGFAVFDIDYRLQDEGGIFPNNLEDVNQAVDYLFNHALGYRIDSGRLGILGISAGAHLALLAAYSRTAGNQHLKTVVAIAPATDLSKIQNPLISRYFSQQDQDKLSKASPLAYAATGIPTLLVHGTSDRVIPFDQSELLAVALRKNHIPVELKAVNNANHGFILKEGLDQEEALFDITRYLKAQLKLNPW